MPPEPHTESTCDVDVIMPCFNTARYVGAALDSALAQSVRCSRIIVIDDGSTDASADVVRRYGSPVEYYRQEHRGVAAARNAGIAHARARYLAFLDADDLWTRDSLAVRQAFLDSHLEVDGVFGAATQFLSPELADVLAARNHFDRSTNIVRFAGTFVVRRAAFDRVGLLCEALKVGEMIEWLGRAAAAGLRIDTLHHKVLERRIHDANTVQRHGMSQDGYLRALKEVIASKRRPAQKAP